MLQVKGAVIGWMGNGKLTLTDNDPYDEQCAGGTPCRGQRMQLSDATTVYKGQNIRYRMVEGSYRLKFEGTGIRLSAVGRGWVTFDGDDRFENDGMLLAERRAFEPIPARSDRADQAQRSVKPQREPRRINQP